MTAVVWKFVRPAQPGESRSFAPVGARFLSVGLQGYDEQDLVLWALVDPDRDQDRRQRKVRVVFTGTHDDEIASWQFVGAVVRRGFVMHVFVEPEPEAAS